MRTSSLLLSPFLCVTHRDRVSNSVYGLCVFSWLFLRKFCTELNLENNSDIITYFYLCLDIHATFVMFICCMLIFLILRYKRWVGGFIVYFCYVVFISHPTRSMTSFLSWDRESLK